MIHGLALCSGVGAMELGLRLALGRRYRCVGHVERDAYAAAVLVARMEDKVLDPAPIWDDLATFDCTKWSGCVDIVTAGFPCQPHSTAGKRRGLKDPRWIWDDVARILREVRPELVFLENVPGLLTTGGFSAVLGDLAEIGFDAEWLCHSAAEENAPHLRNRLWILAADPGRRRQRDGQPLWIGTGGLASVADEDGQLGALAHPDRRRRQPGSRPHESSPPGPGMEHRGDFDRRRPSMPDPDDGRELAVWGGADRAEPVGDADSDGRSRSWPPGPRLDSGGWWSSEPDVGRVADGVASWVDRLRTIGNGVVPATAARAFIELHGRLFK